MPVLVDTNVILDLVYDDPTWSRWSEQQLNARRSLGLLTNELVYAELCAGAKSPDEVDDILNDLDIDLTGLPRQALFLAAKAFVKYRSLGGTKTSPLPDFFIGAHAQASNLALLTRDVGRYRTYFPQVNLVLP